MCLQTNAAIEAALLELEFKPAALRFSSHEDALNYTAHCGEIVSRSLASQSINALNRYIKGDVGCYVRLHSRISDQDCDLALFGIPISCGTNGHPSMSDDIASIKRSRPC